MASLAFVLLSAAIAQQEASASDRSSDGQAALAGEGLPLNPDPVALAAAIAEHVAPVHGMLALGREAFQKMATLCVIRNKRGFEGPQNKESVDVPLPRSLAVSGAVLRCKSKYS